MNQILEAAFNTVHDYPHGGARALSLRLGMGPCSLSHQVKEVGSAKLGLLDAAKVVVLTGDARILHEFADMTGHMVLPLPEVSGGEATATARRLGQLAIDFAGLVSGVMNALEDGTVTMNELAEVHKTYGQMVATGSLMMGAITAKAEASALAARSAGA